MQTSSRGNARLNEYHPAFEEYCETIFELREDDVAVIQALSLIHISEPTRPY